MFHCWTSRPAAPPHCRASAVPLRPHRANQRGVVTVEYLIVFTCMILGVAVTTAAVGPHLVQMLLDVSAWLSLPVP